MPQTAYGLLPYVLISGIVMYFIPYKPLSGHSYTGMNDFNHQWWLLRRWPYSGSSYGTTTLRQLWWYSTFYNNENDSTRKARKHIVPNYMRKGSYIGIAFAKIHPQIYQPFLCTPKIYHRSHTNLLFQIISD